ncbi:MAG: Asp-tRNA(Asn)/Glu-tRNA(Gln) amidotransferase subunit GatC [Bdellovibrionales bacterium]|nr:Asp-tRNA(Asn)/Glu-tRNA(Gln) amidotransferase subunit GatC [Bdellovibrionales bacterium]
MALSKEDIEHIAKLAALELSPDEFNAAFQELNDILNYIDQLQAVDTRGVVATSHVHGVVNAFRDDVIRPSFSKEQVTKNAPSIDERGFRVPKVI